MEQPFKIVCRGSLLSRAQADIVRVRLQALEPEIPVELVIKDTRGDANQDIPLDAMEGKDFFTQDIHDYLVEGKADFAVHSLKDVSGDNFFSGTHYAIIEREDPRDAAIFGEDILERLRAGKKITIGTSSPRRSTMAVDFLRSALPSATINKTNLEALPIRGNVDTRLRKLDDGEYNGIILACAGLNRLLRAHRGAIEPLLSGKRIMILPLYQCPPAPGQGAIVVETTPDNKRATDILAKLNDATLAGAVSTERKVAHQFGSGCHQKFGVIHMGTVGQPFTYAAGRDRSDREFESFFDQKGSPVKVDASVHALDPAAKAFSGNGIRLIQDEASSVEPDETLWVDQTDRWFALARRGVWVSGSSEGLAMEFIEPTLNSPLATLNAIPGLLVHP